MRARHMKLRNTSLGCQYGELVLDENGYVVEAPEGISSEMLLKIPGIVDGDVFDGGLVGDAAKPALRVNTDAEFLAVIQELRAKGIKLNSEGYVDVGSLNAELRARGMSLLTGTKRREIEDKYRQPISGV